MYVDSGRTEFQSASMNRARRSVRFERKPSQRYSRRANFDALHHTRPTSTALTAVAAAATAQNKYVKCICGVTLHVDLVNVMVVWCSGNTLVSINAVALHRARLVLGWVTAFGQVNCLIT